MRILSAGILSALAAMMLLAAPAYAQMPNINLMPEVQSRTPEEKEQDAIRDKAYKDPRRQDLLRSVGRGAQ
jgi:hypothetical protein